MSQEIDRNIIVVDTNVLLSHAHEIYEHPDSEIIIPQIVTDELDKVKLGKAPADRRYHGREITRLLFDFSQAGSLAEGYDIGNGSIVRIAPRVTIKKDEFQNLDLKRSDDQVIATAVLMKTDHPDRNVELLTEDLNMLIKAQAFGLSIKRFEGARESFFSRLRKQRVGFFNVLVLIICFAVLFWAYFLDIRPSFLQQPEPVSRDQFYSITTSTMLDYTQKDPKNAEAWSYLGNVMVGWGEFLAASDRGQEAFQKFSAAREYYQRSLDINPHNEDVSIDLALASYNLGEVDQAITIVQGVLKINPKNVAAQYNYGAFLLEGKQDTQLALIQFKKVLEITQEGEFADLAKQRIAEISGNQTT